MGVHFYSEHEILHKRDVVAATELWYHDVAQSPHAHEFMEIVVVKTGTAPHRMRSGSGHIGPGSVLVVRPGQWHAYDEPQDFRIWNLYIPTKTLAGELAALRSHPVLAAFTSGTIATARLPPSRPDLIRGADNGSSAVSSSSSMVDLRSIEPYLEQLAQPSPRAERSLISSCAGWSDTNYMARRFRAAHGMAPTRYRAEFQHRSKEMAYRLQQQGRSGTKT